MNTRTPAMLISAAALTSTALLGACNDRNRTARVNTVEDPVVRSGAVVVPQSKLYGSETIATSPATPHDPVATSSPASAHSSTIGSEVAVAENPDPPTPAEPTRDQFIFDDTNETRTIETRAASIEQTRARDRAWSERDRTRSTDQDRSLPGADSGREMTMGPNPTRPITPAPASPQSEWQTRTQSDTQSDTHADMQTTRTNQRDQWARTTRDPAADGSLKGPNTPTPAVPTRDAFQFDTAQTPTQTQARATNRSIDTDRTAERSYDRTREYQTDEQSQANTRNSRSSTDQARADNIERPEIYRVDAPPASQSAPAPNPPTPATPTRDDFQFTSDPAQRPQSNTTTASAPVTSEESARDARFAQSDRTSAAIGPRRQAALYESGGNVYPTSPESRILAILHAGNQREIELGRLALERSSSADTRAYAQELIQEHERADARVRELAAEKGYDLPELAMVDRMLVREDDAREPQASRERLSALQGQAFDDAFRARMTERHAELLRIMRDTAPTIEDDEVLALIEDLIPTIEEHETAAYQLTARY